MKVVAANFQHFKRFRNLKICQIPLNTRLVMLVGPNGSGKSSVFDGFLQWQRSVRFGIDDRQIAYYVRPDVWAERQNLWREHVKINLDIPTPEDWDGRRNVFYFRSAYRFEEALSVNSIGGLTSVLEEQRITTMSESDVSVSRNYSRLVSNLIKQLHDTSDDYTAKGAWREKQYESLKVPLLRLFPSLQLESPVNPLEEGSFFFSKGTSRQFAYGNLSSGEKSALDLILDLHVRASAFKDGIFCIDEPEAHMNANLHGALLEEIYKLIPSNGQLWVATHSIGMIRKAVDLDNADPGSVIFLDFHDKDFDQEVVLTPARVNTSFWARNFQTTLADFAKLVAPRQIVLCEGARVGANARNLEFDARCYQKIFEAEFPETMFISVGSSNDIVSGGPALRGIINKIVEGVNVVTVIDRDERTPDEIEDARRKGHRVLPKRHIEHYLLSDEVLGKLCDDLNKSEAISGILAAKNAAINNLVGRGHPADDMKRAKGEIYNAVKTFLRDCKVQFGSDADVFCRDVMAPRITPGMSTYAELRSAIFDRV